MMKKQKIAVLGPGSWGTALAQVLNDNGHEVRIWGNIPEQIDEINEKHTNTRYFKDVILDENIKAYKELSEALDSVNAILFVVPTKVTRLVAKQVAELLDHKVVVMHASKGLEPGTHERLSTILEEEIPHAGVLVQQDGFGLSVVQGFHVCFLPIFIVSRCFGLYRRYYSTTEGKTESLWTKFFSLLRRFFPLFSVFSLSLPLGGPAEWPLVEPNPLL